MVNKVPTETKVMESGTFTGGLNHLFRRIIFSILGHDFREIVYNFYGLKK